MSLQRSEMYIAHGASATFSCTPPDRPQCSGSPQPSVSLSHPLPSLPPSPIGIFLPLRTRVLEGLICSDPYCLLPFLGRLSGWSGILRKAAGLTPSPHRLSWVSPASLVHWPCPAFSPPPTPHALLWPLTSCGPRVRIQSTNTATTPSVSKGRVWMGGWRWEPRHPEACLQQRGERLTHIHTWKCSPLPSKQRIDMNGSNELTFKQDSKEQETLLLWQIFQTDFPYLLHFVARRCELLSFVSGSHTESCCLRDHCSPPNPSAEGPRAARTGTQQAPRLPSPRGLSPLRFKVYSQIC